MKQRRLPMIWFVYVGFLLGFEGSKVIAALSSFRFL